MKPLSILVVDDSEADHFLLEHNFKKYNEDISYLQAHDGFDALRLLKQKHCSPDLILLDINMPGMNGYEFLEYYHAKHLAGSPIVVMNSDCTKEEELKLKAKYKHIKAIIAKPVSINKLLDILPL